MRSRLPSHAPEQPEGEDPAAMLSLALCRPLAGLPWLCQPLAAPTWVFPGGRMHLSGHGERGQGSGTMPFVKWTQVGALPCEEEYTCLSTTLPTSWPRDSQCRLLTGQAVLPQQHVVVSASVGWPRARADAAPSWAQKGT